jgi:hypothetical protein
MYKINRYIYPKIDHLQIIRIFLLMIMEWIWRILFNGVRLFIIIGFSGGKLIWIYGNHLSYFKSFNNCYIHKDDIIYPIIIKLKNANNKY